MSLYSTYSNSNDTGGSGKKKLGRGKGGEESSGRRLS